MPRLGVNIDHIATLRQARRASYPDPFYSLQLLLRCQVDQVTLHLREDRRHIQDDDLRRIIFANILPVNMEMAAIDEMVEIAGKYKPQTCTLVPEKREEITTEGGLDCFLHEDKLNKIIHNLQEKGMKVSLFIDPEEKQIDSARRLKCDRVELHTGSFCEAYSTPRENVEFQRLKKAVQYAISCGMKVFAGHGLNRDNLPKVATLTQIEEYNIGHSIIARSVFVGLETAIREIQNILKDSCIS